MSTEKLFLELTNEEAVFLYLRLAKYCQILEDEYSVAPVIGEQNEINEMRIIISKVFELIKPIPDLSDLEELRKKMKSIL
jgi:hypothetical protein